MNHTQESSLFVTYLYKINNHLPRHLSQPTHLGTYPKTTTGTDRGPTILVCPSNCVSSKSYLGKPTS